MIMNEHDIDTALRRHRHHPLLGPATWTLGSLRNAVNAQSDGWAYWRAPSAAAKQLMALIQAHQAWERTEYQRPRQGAEATAKALREAYAQLRRFRTVRAAVSEIDFTIYAAPDVPGDLVPEPAKPTVRLTVTGDQATLVLSADLAAGRYTGTVSHLVADLENLVTEAEGSVAALREATS
jgi:hypothetical protein